MLFAIANVSFVATSVASISPAWNALMVACDSICLNVTRSSFGFSPHHFSLGTNDTVLLL